MSDTLYKQTYRYFMPLWFVLAAYSFTALIVYGIPDDIFNLSFYIIKILQTGLYLVAGISNIAGTVKFSFVGIKVAIALHLIALPELINVLAFNDVPIALWFASLFGFIAIFVILNVRRLMLNDISKVIKDDDE